MAALLPVRPGCCEPVKSAVQRYYAQTAQKLENGANDTADV
jgi:hypothetical protein